MTRLEYKLALRELLNQDVEGLTEEKKAALVKKTLMDHQIEYYQSLTHRNHRKKWKDEELRVILKDAPTKENCLMYARLFERNYGSIELIYRWAATASRDIPEEYRNNRFIKQIKRIAKEVGWRAT